MKKNALCSMAAILFLISAVPVSSAETVQNEGSVYFFAGVLKLRVFEGLKEGSTPAQNITSSYLKYTLSANIPTDAALEAEQGRIRKTFNLKDVKLVTESKVSWQKGEPQEARQMFRLDGKLYEVSIKPKNVLSHTFHIVVNEVSEKKNGNLLDTEFTIPQKNIAVFGFEDSSGKPYFISFREESVGMATEAGVIGGVIGGVEGGVKGGVSGGVEGKIEGGVKGSVVGGVVGGPQSEEMEKKREEFRKGAVPIKGNIKQPKLIKMAKPVYPEEARKNGVQGVVILEAKIDEQGRVIDVMILRSVPALDQAAIDAVKQWVYEPLIIDGKPTKALFTTTVNFKLSEEDIERFAEGAVKVTDAIKPPKLIKKIEPVYPAAARQAGVEGVVILEARTDVDGRVKNVRVLRSVPLLDQAAIEAVRQWAYEPLIIDGHPKEAIFTTTVRFALKDKEEKGQAEATATGEVLVPKLIKRIDPVYPEAARQAGIQGLVLLEATTDEKGDVVAIRVLKSIPELDQAAIDALKKWKYEPFIIEGKPKGVVFTVTIQFRLQ
ncbi:MAG: energy transducer TonB [Candidatus Aminicenantales bacterium]